MTRPTAENYTGQSMESGEASGNDQLSNGDSADTPATTKNPHRRVKVYMLNSERAWDDKGTGHVSCAYIEKFQGMALIVRSEEEDSSIILESKVCPNTAYQKQQDTLICWSENDQELALSFQLIDSCSEIWEKICNVQGRDPGDSSSQDDSLQDSRDDENFEENYASSLLVELPPVDLAHLSEILNVFNENTMHNSAVQWRMERLSTSIEADSYIPKLLELFTMCDDLENVEALNQLYAIFKTIFMLNKNALFESMFSQENLMKVVGVLEYDPSKKVKVKHREYLENAKFHSVLPIQNQALLGKIHQTYRVQYIQDAILPTPSVFDENSMSALNSFIFFNKCEIVRMLQEDVALMRSLFQQLTDDETGDEQRRYLIKFLKEFCTFSSTLQAAERDTFFQMLCDNHLLEAVETLWNLDDSGILNTTNDVFAFIVEANPGMVREFCLSEAKLGQDELLVTRAIEQMQRDSDPEQGGAVLLSTAIRLLVDPENMVPVTGAQSLRSEKTEFLNYFYQHCMPALIAPLKTLTPEYIPDDYSNAQLLNLTIELLTFCAEHHSYQFKTMLIRQELLRRMLYLLRSRHAFLALCALRFMRKLISIKEPDYSKHLVNGNHVKMVCEAFLANGEKYNLFNSAVIEMFECIRVDSMKSIANHFVECHYNSGFQDIHYVQTFKLLKEQFSANESLPSSEDGEDVQKGGPQRDRFRRDSNAFDEEEENWFEQDEDTSGAGSVTPPLDIVDDINVTPSTTSYVGTPIPDDKKTQQPFFPKSLKRAKDDDDDDLPFGSPKLQRTISINLKSLISDSPPLSPQSSSPNTSPNSAPTTTPSTVPKDTSSAASKFPLVDYPDEDSDDENDVESANHKRPRISL